MKVLLTGSNGQLGRCIQDRFPASWSLKATDHAEIDITHKDQLTAFIDYFKPDVIINTAAYTAVDKAEQEPEQANRVNHLAPRYLAELAEKYTIRLIHISTDYVFDGQKQTPYLETDQTSPINVYGKTKLLGEQAIMAINPSAIILRTSWVFSEYGNNFVKTILRLAKGKQELSIVADQFGKPTYAGDLAAVIISIIERKRLLGGIYHYSGDITVSWFEFAKAIVAQASQLNQLSHSVTIYPVTTAQYPTLAKRPKYSVLSCNKIDKNGIQCSNWLNSLEQIIDKINGIV